MPEFSIYSSSPRFLSCDLDRVFVWIDPEVRGGWVFRGPYWRQAAGTRPNVEQDLVTLGLNQVHKVATPPFFAGRKSDPDIVEWRENRKPAGGV